MSGKALDRTGREARLFRSAIAAPGDLEGLNVTVMGLGLFGGGAGAARFLVSRGARVTVTDLKDPGALKKSLALLEGLPLRLVLGEHRREDFIAADLVVANPAVPPESPLLAKAAARGVPVESEINLTLKFLPTPHVVGVTGSNGKTTTAHLVHRMAAASGRRTWLGGNTGGSLLTDLDRIGPYDVVVLELSSFQLETTGAAGLGPRVAVVTNVTPNHLDRHGTFEAYAAAKKKILVAAEGAVFNAEDPLTQEMMEVPGPGKRILFSSRRPLDDGFFIDSGWIVQARRGRTRKLAALGDVTLPGLFNKENLMAALAATGLVLCNDDIPEAAVRAGASFEGVPHRLERVDEIEGVRFVNDSIATTPESTIAALSALEGEIALIAGGYDKKIPFDGLARAVRDRVRALFLVGATAGKVEEAVRKACGGAGGPRIIRAETVETAVEAAFKEARPGWTVLLSPACASYDQFANFEERGASFKKHVQMIRRRCDRVANREFPT